MSRQWTQKADMNRWINNKKVVQLSELLLEVMLFVRLLVCSTERERILECFDAVRLFQNICTFEVKDQCDYRSPDWTFQDRVDTLLCRQRKRRQLDSAISKRASGWLPCQQKCLFKTHTVFLMSQKPKICGIKIYMHLCLNICKYSFRGMRWKFDIQKAKKKVHR